MFFRIVGLGDDDEPLGAQGMPLTPGRSIAVDKALHVYGTPFFIDAELPIDYASVDDAVPPADDRAGHRLGHRRPGARRSLLGRRQAGRPGRGPGAGIAGRFTMLIPREIDPVEAGARMPLPLPRPADADRAPAAAEARAAGPHG